jgi:hypothetical protein
MYKYLLVLALLFSCTKKGENICSNPEVNSAYEEISEIDATIKERVFLFDKKLEENGEREPLHNDPNYLEMMNLKSKRDELIVRLFEFSSKNNGCQYQGKNKELNDELNNQEID